MSDREEFEANRAAGLKARHETRVERAIRRQVANEIVTTLDPAYRCTEKCWSPLRCEHDREMTPRGRSVPLERPNFCDCYEDYRKNPRHLWDEHDDARFYSDPHRWRMHLASCAQCRGDDE